MEDRRERQRRLDRARVLGQLELVVAFAAIPLIVLLYVLAPGTRGPMMISEKLDLGAALLPFIVIVGPIGGLGWMIRIYRGDPEPGERTWRYRDF